MRILVLSDTHGCLTPLPRLIEQTGRPDALFHLGDYCRDAYETGLYLNVPVYAVKGNCDRGEDEEEEKSFTLGGKRFLLLHGHTCSLLSLAYKGVSSHADAVLFGHTHEPAHWYEGRTLFLNPGSLSSPRGGSLPSAAVLSWDEGSEIALKFHTLPKED